MNYWHAEIAGLQTTLADSRAYVERLKKRLDTLMAHNAALREHNDAAKIVGVRQEEIIMQQDARIKVLEDALRGLDEAYCRAGSPLTKAERHEDRMRLIAARASLGDSAPTTPPPSPSPRS